MNKIERTNENPSTVFLPLRQVAERGPFSHWHLRQLLKKNALPGVYTGRIFLVNYNMFCELLNTPEGMERFSCPSKD